MNNKVDVNESETSEEDCDTLCAEDVIEIDEMPDGVYRVYHDGEDSVKEVTSDEWAENGSETDEQAEQNEETIQFR